MKTHGPTRTVALILGVLVLLPALFYSVYEVNALSSSEELVADVYRRQLDVVLFSINQYAWDVVNGWAGELIARARDGSGHTLLQGGMQSWLERHAAIDAVFLVDSSARGLRLVTTRGVPDAHDAARLEHALEGEKATTVKLIAFSRQEYRKLEPVVLDEDTGTPQLYLLFAYQDRRGLPVIAGIGIDESRFVGEVLAPRLQEAAGTEFVLAVLQRNGDVLYGTGDVRPEGLKQRRQLWLFPQLAVGVRLRGATIEDVARSRFTRNLALILLLDGVLLGGVWFVYRSVRREMDFVRLKSDFVSNVSHELRTPLALIRMYAETLELARVKSEEKRQEYYRTIVKETERLTRLVNNLLNFSRMEAGRKPYTLVPTDLNAVVRTVLETFTPHLRNEGFAPEVSLASRLPEVQADGEAVQEALINLLDNAVRYSPAERFLRVATGSGNGSAFVEVTDHGAGIAEEHQTKVFETFYRVPGTRAGPTGGSGLGLSIARHIMGAHNGRIELASAPGRGSTFRLVFPLPQDAP
ncbi:MAG: ATP-binding protein [Bacteroidota bacterium]